MLPETTIRYGSILRIFVTECGCCSLVALPPLRRSWRKAEELRIPDATTSPFSHSTALTLEWDEFPCSRKPCWLPFSREPTSLGSGFCETVQWLSKPSSVCKPFEVPMAKRALSPIGHAAEHQREGVVRIRIGWETWWSQLRVNRLRGFDAELTERRPLIVSLVVWSRQHSWRKEGVAF